MTRIPAIVTPSLTRTQKLVRDILSIPTCMMAIRFQAKLVSVCDDMDAFTDLLWNNLNEDNKVSLFVRYINLENGTYKTKIVNKNK